MKTKTTFATVLLATVCILSQTAFALDYDNGPIPILMPASLGKVVVQSKTKLNSEPPVVIHKLNMTGNAALPIFTSLEKVDSASVEGKKEIVKKIGKNVTCTHTKEQKPNKKIVEFYSCEMTVNSGNFKDYTLHVIPNPKPLPIKATNSTLSVQVRPEGLLVKIIDSSKKQKSAYDIYDSLHVAYEVIQLPADGKAYQKDLNDISCIFNKPAQSTSCTFLLVGGVAKRY